MSGVTGLTTGLQQLPPSQIPFQTYANYAMGPPQMSSSFRVDPPTDLSIYVGDHYGVCFLHSGFHMDTFFHLRGSNIGVCTTAALGSLPMAGICASW